VTPEFTSTCSIVHCRGSPSWPGSSWSIQRCVGSLKRNDIEPCFPVLDRDRTFRYSASAEKRELGREGSSWNRKSIASRNVWKWTFVFETSMASIVK